MILRHSGDISVWVHGLDVRLQPQAPLAERDFVRPSAIGVQVHTSLGAEHGAIPEPQCGFTAAQNAFYRVTVEDHG